jgi:hypothetical protein
MSGTFPPALLFGFLLGACAPPALPVHLDEPTRTPAENVEEIGAQAICESADDAVTERNPAGGSVTYCME